MGSYYARIGGKIHGPFPSDQIKRLAASGKLTREDALSSDGKTWVPAGNAKGLFPPAEMIVADRPAASKSRSAATPTVVRSRSPSDDEVMSAGDAAFNQPAAYPPIPPRPPVTHATFSQPAYQPVIQQTNVVVERPRYGGNSLAIASIILAVLAFLFCWIPLVGLISIPVAALGVLLGGLGIIIALFRGGAGAGFSIAGLLLSVFAIIITFSMTKAVAESVASVSTTLNEAASERSATNQTIVPSESPAAGALTTNETADAGARNGVAATPREPAVNSRQKPEPQWANARDAVQQGDVRVKVTSVKVDFAEVESFRDASKSEDKLLLIGLHVDNLSDAKKLNFRGFAGSQFDFSGDSRPMLEDNLGNVYKRINFGVDRIIGQVQSESVYPGKSVDDLLVFEVPVDKAKSLRLELPASAFGGEGKLRIEIPAEMIER